MNQHKSASLARWALAFVLCSFCAQGAPSYASRPSADADLTAQPDDAGIAAEAVPSSKMDTAIARMAQLAGASLHQVAQERAIASDLRLEQGRLQTRISVKPDAAEKISAVIASLGGEVTGRAAEGELLQAWLPLDALTALAAHADVTMIRRPAMAQPLEQELLQNDVISEGVYASLANSWQQKGYRGQGVRIGVIDIGFQGYQSLLGDELPSQVIVKNWVDGQLDAQVDGTSPHGTACAEVVHDMAPEAALYLAKIATDIDLFEAVAWLRDVHQVHVISTSLGWYNLSPGDGSGVLAELVNSAKTAGILWVTAAGNMRRVHWGGPWADNNGNSELNFTPTQDWNLIDLGQGYELPSGQPIGVYVRWSDWAAVNQDYDIYLLRWSLYGIWDVIESSTDPQKGAPGQTPTEYVFGYTFGEPTYYAFAIRRIKGSAPVQFEAFVPKASLISTSVAARSLPNLADAPSALTVGAVHHAMPYGHRPYSS